MLKKCIKTEGKNYRYISLLPLISKVIEKSIYNKTQDYLQRNELLYSYQSGFRANCSADARLSRLTDMVLNGVESRQTTVIILINLQRAFYTLNHKIVLDKMKCIGFSDKKITWVHSYLTNRFIFFSVGIVFSESGIINCEVPQESILGPLLFLLYINDIPQALSNTHTFLYAHGTSIFCQHIVFKEIKNVLNKQFANVLNCFFDNKLSIHFGEDKTKCILLGRDKNLPELNITNNKNRIKQYCMVECLG